MGENKAIEKISRFQKFGSVLGLERMTALLALLGNPEKKLKVIHVAGTNGKGSICRYVYSVLQEAGYRCGLYTSPFLEIFNERIEFNGDYISDEDLEVYTDKVLEKVKQMTEEGKQSPTEFEVITAIAFLYFAEKKADYVVLEVGLGGTGDSTNVVKHPLVSIIASISYDHMDRLGSTLEEIAGEKAGIIKEGCPVVTSAEYEEALQVIRKRARNLHSDLVETAGVEYKKKEKGLKGATFDVIIKNKEFRNLNISMIGEHQIKNAICGLTALELLREDGKISLSDEHIYRGLKKAKQIGRMEVLFQGGEKGNTPLILLDGAHNQDGAHVLRSAMEEFGDGKKILMITGMLADKDIDGILEEFTKITKEFIVTEPDNPRKLEAETLREKLVQLDAGVILEKSVKKIVDIMIDKKDQYDVILCAGSLYLIGEIRKIIRERVAFS